MAFELIAQNASGLINTIALSWSGGDRFVTVYRSTSEINITPADGEEIDWSEATAVVTNSTETSASDAGLEPGTYYYYATDGTSVVAATGGAKTIPAGTQYAPEIQADYEPVPLNKVTQNSAYMNALNSSGSVKLNTLKVPAGELAIVAIVRTTAITEAELGQALYNANINGFAILQSGTVESFGGYEAQLSGSTQVKYVASK